MGAAVALRDDQGILALTCGMPPSSIASRIAALIGRPGFFRASDPGANHQRDRQQDDAEEKKIDESCEAER